ncbi:alpha-N-acetylglucosaminidase [Fulvivirga sp. M361]|uniref:alpha-N-acetylglucosaminidase n=1 Tax=Fulvivirga sp. M361 TaxID=2594266 RepID=UPI00117AC913|nr:alpha-N-acetylglucosaminidase [Fulvivirga sp. M361]TRX49684.1 alpha-N-acetylglucosaminidase [Fulvivirga sp. M361]
MIHILKIYYVQFLSYIIVLGFAISGCQPERRSLVVTASKKLIGRLVPQHDEAFIVEEIMTDPGKEVFEIEQADGRKIIIRGNNPVSIASGMNYYMKHFAKCHFSWNGDQLDLPEKLPPVDQKVRKESLYTHHFNFNYCTFNYTMPWWTWEQWEREIDLMATNGINMPLAIVGMEGVWLNFLQRFGYSDGEAREFIAGPAYTAWWLMGNLEGRGGPVTSEWITNRIHLQQKILERMRELGMRPALPGFVGLVPTNLEDKQPAAKILEQGRWLNDIRPAVLDPEDPLFDQMAKAWYEELEKLYGKVDVFTGDLFHEGGRTHGLDVGNIATKVQRLMLDHNPESTWAIQGWGGNPKPALLDGLTTDNTLVLELCGEYFRNWESSNGFYGKPWVFSTIIQYGGNIALHGRMEALADNLDDALKINNPPAGIGTTWESIEINAVVNDFLADMRWEHEVPDLTSWTSEYAARRYGFDSPAIRRAWDILLKTAYGSFEGHRRPTEPIFCARPSFQVKKVSPFAASIEVHYDQRELRDAVKLMLEGSEKGRHAPGYVYDVVDFTRQFMANAAQIPYYEMLQAFHEKNLAEFEEHAARFLEMLDDQDRLLGTESSFLLGKWLDDARNIAPNEEQRRQNESNARMLITTWTKERSGLGDYAWREWNGLLKTYYKPRWEMFINELRRRLQGAPAQEIDFFNFESKWAAQTWADQSYRVEPTGDGIALARKLIRKWGALPDKYDGKVPVKSKGSFKNEKAQDAR